MLDNKISRNAPCSCGSGKKYKKCCLNRVEEPKGRIISSSIGDYKIVAIGNKLFTAKNVVTFADFLTKYIQTKLGRRFWETELKESVNDRHPIMQIYQKMVEIQSSRDFDSNGLAEADSGIELYWYHFGYDLYILDSHLDLQQCLINRLKIPDQFQGARYELFVTSVLINTGFKIDYAYSIINDKKYPEFDVILDDDSRISIEVKSKHRLGVLGFDVNTAKDSKRPSVKYLIKSALQKNVCHPYFIFIDVNLDPDSMSFEENEWRKEIDSTVLNVHQKEILSKKKIPVNCYFFSNIPYHYINTTYKAKSVFYSKEILTPSFNLPNQGDIIERINRSFEQLNKILNFN